MKVSVSISDDDLEFLDSYTREQGLASRSAAVQQAIRLLRSVDLVSEYELAWAEAAAPGDQTADWDAVVGDGLDD